MDLHVVVHAEFPKVTNDQREKIYGLLRQNGWKKIETNGICISTTWLGKYNGNLDTNLDTIKNHAKSEFETATSNLNCARPSLIIHVGFDAPLVCPI